MKIIALIVLITFPIFGYSQENKKCNIEKVRIANLSAGSLTEKICLDFLMTIDSICINDVEFGEFSNGTLFKILESNPRIIVTTVDTYPDRIDKGLILKILQDPIDDLIDLSSIRSKLIQLDVEYNSKREIIESIDIAISKY